MAVSAPSRPSHLNPLIFQAQKVLTPIEEILEIVGETDHHLSDPCVAYDFAEHSQDETDELYHSMVRTMRKYRGLGLAANQVRKNYRLFIVDTGTEFPEAFFNPRIVDTGPNMMIEEGCLSFPKLFVKVRRPSTVRIRYQLLNGETTTQNYEGLTARCILHEYDHIEGLTMKDRATRFHWEQATNKRKRIK